MSVFAIAAEGPTDFAVLKNILIGWCKPLLCEEPEIRQIQPLPHSESGELWQKFGNWENVLRFLREKKYIDPLSLADYLIIQIDTDQSEHVNFGVPQLENGHM